MLIDRLEKLGLNRKEAQIYLAAMELGETNIERLSKKSKIKRTTVYDIVESLKEKGLMGSTFDKKKRRIFANDPRIINDKLDEQKAIFTKLIPELLSISNLMDNKPRIKFFEGVEGLKEIYMDTLKHPDKPLWALVSDEVFDVMGDEFLASYIGKRVKHRIMAYVIAPDNELMRRYKLNEQKQLRQTRLIDGEKYPFGVEIDLYGSYKIGIMSFKERMGLIIESKKLYDTLKSIFDFSWSHC